MKKIETKMFIEVYAPFYFEDSNLNEIDFERYGIPKNLNRTNSMLEHYIIDKIKSGIYDEEAFAWKAGKATWENNKFTYLNPLPEKWINGNGGEIKEKKDTSAFSKTYVSGYRYPSNG